MDHLDELVKKISNKERRKEIDAKVLTPFFHFRRTVQQHKEKRIFTMIVPSLNYWLKIDPEKLRIIDDIADTLYDSLILGDDLLDDSDIRKGIPTAHQIYGRALTLNSSVYVLIKMLKSLISLNHPDVVQVFHDQLCEIFRGEGIEIYWRENFICPTEEEYILMAFQKTGGYYMTLMSIMQLFSQYKGDFSKLVYLIGLYFQMINDYNNLTSDCYHEEKSFADDLTEGKFGYPVVYAIEREKPDNQIFCIIKQRPRDDLVKKYCVDIVRKMGAFEYTERMLSVVYSEIMKEMKKFEPNPILEEALNEIRKHSPQN